MQIEQTKENKMGVMPIPKLLISLSLPMIISMLVQALYNIVDSMFVAQISEDALTAVSLAFPIQNLMIAVSVGTGVGVNALVSRYLGSKSPNEASIVAKTGLFLAFISYLITAILGATLASMFYRSQTTSVDIISHGTDYMRIICLFSCGLFFQVTIERLLQSTGKTVYNMIVQSTGAIINIILDPILIFGLLGFPRMEVAGAALATICGQTVAAILGIILCIKCNRELNINMKSFKPDAAVIKNIYQIGFPAIVMQSIGSIMIFGFNAILLVFSTTAAAVFGIYFKLQSFIFLPVFGLTNGLISIVAYNYGAKSKKRIVSSFHLAILLSVSIMLLGTLAFQLIPELLLSLFEASPQMVELGVPALRIISLSFPFAGYCIVCSSIFQALGYSMYSLFLSLARQLAAILPLAYILAHAFGLNYIWWSFPLAEIISIICSYIYTRKVFHKTINQLDERNALVQ